jgi:hypothetical protein
MLSTAVWKLYSPKQKDVKEDIFMKSTESRDEE